MNQFNPSSLPSLRSLHCWAIPCLLLLVASCRTKFYEKPSQEQALAGTVDFNKYVAIGSTIESGYADNALYTEAQQNAYPNLLAQKIKESNPALVFGQADIQSINGWSANGKGKSVLRQPSCIGVSIKGTTLNGDANLQAFAGDPNLVTNLSLPFLTLDSLFVPLPPNNNAKVAGTYFHRVFASQPSTHLAHEARRRNGTFFTVNVGYTEALRFATSGGDASKLMPVAEFQLYLEQLLDSLTAQPSAKGVIATVPYVDLFPIVTNNNRRLTSTTDPARNPVTFTPEQAAYFNEKIGAANLFKGTPGNKNNYAVAFGDGSIGQLDPTKDFIINGTVLDKSGFGKVDEKLVRECTYANDAHLAPRDSTGFLVPIANKDILDRKEITLLRNRINEYNNVIRSAVNKRNTNGAKIAVVDLQAFYNKLTDPLMGIVYNSFVIRANQPSLGPDFGGFYSLDRITPTPRGQAALANEFIRVINATWGASLHEWDPQTFRGNVIQ